ncbi:CHAT domain-containing protein [Leptolyngbya sp. FACHB-17]|uniref:CHAT domain-containing protein n=1 Tax=unclassified Leptolyngbya TaxID=2650499 RepID=UPI0016811E7B|nr:CHAT domain-containing protein [Leptolyngbya sp. FACHB-17]MBD2080634.1 CHAT domain-containing protein [Leptolyngbya sp. FACHB-17]
MPQPNSDSTQNTFNISNSPITNLAGSGSIQYNEALAKNDTLPETESHKKVILFLAAQPIATAKLRLDEEIRGIDEGLKRSQHRDRFELKQQWAVRPRDLQRAMLDCKPQIVHFSGHGIGRATDAAQSSEATRKLIPVDHVETFEEGLILEDQTGQAKLVSTEALAALFELFTDSVECVVLNACYSERQAKAIAQHVPYVIGMNQAIGDRAAIEFAIGFYDAMGAGESIDRAYKLACVAIQMAEIPEQLIPVMKHKT